jgi:hypothetical protein
MSGVLVRGLVVACWAAVHVGYLAMLFGFSLVPQAIAEQYANGPLPSTPGPVAVRGLRRILAVDARIPALAAAVLFAVVGVAMIRVLPKPRALPSLAG